MGQCATGPIRRLLIVAECGHAWRDGSAVCPEHFRVEIDEWARYVESIRLLTNFPPIRQTPPGWGKYQAANIEVIQAQGAFSGEIVERILSLGRSTIAISRIMAGFRWADAVHVRGPTRNALLALVVASVIQRPLYFKWAGQWVGNRKWHLAARLQRKVLMRRGKDMAVTVYEFREEDPPWIFVADTASVTEEQLRRAVATSRSEHDDGATELLWVGRLTDNKNVGLLLRTVRHLQGQGLRNLELHLVGEGSQRAFLEEECCRLGIADSVVFHGILSWAELCTRYRRARVFLLPSGTEGFPKVVHEALLFGTPVVAFSVGAIPRMLRGRGLAVDPAQGWEGFSEAVQRLLVDQKLWHYCSENGRKWAAGISIEKVVARHVATCERQWNRLFGCFSPTETGIQPWRKVD